jgi:hypothetical protein
VGSDHKQHRISRIDEDPRRRADCRNDSSHTSRTKQEAQSQPTQRASAASSPNAQNEIVIRLSTDVTPGAAHA